MNTEEYEEKYSKNMWKYGSFLGFCAHTLATLQIKTPIYKSIIIH
jgi:hypothetical protein